MARLREKSGRWVRVRRFGSRGAPIRRATAFLIERHQRAGHPDPPASRPNLEQGQAMLDTLELTPSRILILGGFDVFRTEPTNALKVRTGRCFATSPSNDAYSGLETAVGAHLAVGGQIQGFCGKPGRIAWIGACAGILSWTRAELPDLTDLDGPRWSVFTQRKKLHAEDRKFWRPWSRQQRRLLIPAFACGAPPSPSNLGANGITRTWIFTLAGRRPNRPLGRDAGRGAWQRAMLFFNWPTATVRRGQNAFRRALIQSLLDCRRLPSPTNLRWLQDLWHPRCRIWQCGSLSAEPPSTRSKSWGWQPMPSAMP